ncbi:hypothetical protein GCM10025858_24820 [Alicyclobacillus sacchari]|nr:hypothetical protein GCM10025858_24820 [Alicyclobacillus sacchari]
MSRYGLIAFASSLDQIGPFTRTAEDAAIVLNAICGHDPMDSTSARGQGEIDFTEGMDAGVKGMRIGIVRNLPEEGLNPAVKAAVDEAIRTLEQAGAEVVEVELPHMEYAVATYYLIAPAEASSNLARFDGVRYGRRAEASGVIDMFERSRSEGFGMEVKRRIIIGTYALSSGYYDAYYKRAQQMRTLIRQDYDRAFATCDVILMPTTPTTAFKFGEKADNPLQMYLNDIYTIPANLAGLPGASVPCGFADGLPIGLQILAKPFDEKSILRVAHAYEHLRTFAWQRPCWGWQNELRNGHWPGSSRRVEDGFEDFLWLQKRQQVGAEHQRLPGVHGSSRRPSGTESKRTRTGAAGGTCFELQDQSALQI